MISFLEILSGEYIAKDNYKCQRWVHRRVYLVIKATNCPLSFSHLQLFIISDLSQPDQLNFPWKMEKEASLIQSQSKGIPWFQRLTWHNFFLVPHLMYFLANHLLYPLFFLFKLIKSYSEFIFIFFKILFSGPEVFQITIKYF